MARKLISIRAAAAEAAKVIPMHFGAATGVIVPQVPPYNMMD